MNIAIILPAFNEEVTIQSTISAFHQAIPEASIYVVNNNSTDRTGELAAALLSEIHNTGYVIVEQKQGKGNAVKTAFSHINADIYVLVDADLTYPAYQVRELIAALLKHKADMVVGNRQANGNYKSENKRSFHVFGNQLVNYLVNRIFSAKLLDIMSGYRVFSNRFVKNYPILVEGFEIETDITLHALHHQFKIVEVDIEYKDRPEGSQSKLNTFSDGFRIIFTVLQIFRFYKPFMFFGYLALFFAMTSLCIGYIPIKEFIDTHYITKIPLVILASGLGILSVVLLGIGLMLDALRRQEDMQYQLHLLNWTQRK
jgi:glycosyltransferase involved in cell wall biosynthesis